MLAVLVGGLFLGAIYGLFAVGLVMIYRGDRIVNFAYGETGMIGAFVFAACWQDVGLPVLIAVLVGVGASAAVGGATELLVARPLRGRSRLLLMVATFAVATLLVTIAGRVWGLNPEYLPPLQPGDGVRLGGITVSPSQMIVVGVTAIVLAGLVAAYRLTPFGLRLRALAIDPYAAALTGVGVNRTALQMWALAGAVAGLSAILIAPLVAFHVYFMTQLSLRGIAAALLGGMTSISGAFLGGIGLGVAEALISYTAPVTGITEAALAALILAVVLLRPTGLVKAAY